MTARVHTDFLSIFLAFLLICSILFSFLRTRDEHVWASWGLRQARASSCECVWCARSHSGPVRSRDWARLDLAVLGLWQSSCAPRSRASLRNVSKEFNSINLIQKKEREKSYRATPGLCGPKTFVVLLCCCHRQVKKKKSLSEMPFGFDPSAS